MTIRRSAELCTIKFRQCYSQLSMIKLLFILSLLAVLLSRWNLRRLRSDIFIGRIVSDTNMPILTVGQSTKPAQDIDSQKNIKLAAKRPIVIAMMTKNYFGTRYDRPIEACRLENVPLTCSYQTAESLGEAGTRDADVLWYHAPHLGLGQPVANKTHTSQLRVIMSMESSAYYPQEDNPEYMAQFDVTSTYRRSSDIPVYYLWYNSELPDRQASVLEGLLRTPVPLAEKKKAMAYCNRNCHAPNGRHGTVQAIVNLGIVPVDGYSGCGQELKNTTRKYPGRLEDKEGTFSSYRFCIAMENSNRPDYVTEKLWQALNAGCVPIYDGDPNVKDILPDPESILFYPDFDRDPLKLSREIDRLMHDDQAYLDKLAWKHKSLDQLSPAFQSYVKEALGESDHCRVCQRVIQERIKSSETPTSLRSSSDNLST